MDPDCSAAGPIDHSTPLLSADSLGRSEQAALAHHSREGGKSSVVDFDGLKSGSLAFAGMSAGVQINPSRVEARETQAAAGEGKLGVAVPLEPCRPQALIGFDHTRPMPA